MVSKRDRLLQLQTELHEHASDRAIPTAARSNLDKATKSVADALIAIDERADDWGSSKAMITNLRP